MKYAILYVVLAEAYLFLYSLLVLFKKSKINVKEKLISISSLVLIFLQSILGRDLIGSYLVNVFDYFHVIGLINFILLILLIQVEPDKILSFNTNKS